MNKLRKLKEETISLFGGSPYYGRTTKATFIVTITTGSMKFAGTDSNVFIGLTGASGEKSSLVRLDNAFRNDFERASVDRFHVRLEDIGVPVILTIKHDETGMFSDWFVVSVTVQKEGEAAVHKFPISMWVGGLLEVVEEAKSPGQEENPILISFHKRKLAQSKASLTWRFSENIPQSLPGFILAEFLEDIPRNFRLDEEMVKDFDGKKKIGKFNVFERISNALRSVENISDIKGIFLNPKLPNVPEFQQHWERDEEFGRQILNGVNPTILKQCKKIPEKFPVLNAMVVCQLTRGLTLNEEVEKGNIFIIDLEILEETSGGKTRPNSTFCAPICLLYLNNKKLLVPIAIQLGQNPSENNPIWTPDDSECDWLLAKIYFRNAECNFQLIVEKILKTHFILEPFAIACCRCFSSRHPVLKLLLPHLRYVCGGNFIIRTALLNQGGILDRVLSFGSGDQFRVMREAFKYFNFKHCNIRELLRLNGTIKSDALPGYYFRDDALNLWDALERFVSKVFSIFYNSDEEISRDGELQTFIHEVAQEGFASNGDHRDGIPTQISSVEELIELVTSIIFTSSCRNAAVTSGLYDILINVPNSPLCMALPPHQDRGKTTHDRILESLPSKQLSQMQMSFCHSYMISPKTEVKQVCCMIVPDEKSYLGDPAKATLADFPNFLFSEEIVQSFIDGLKEELEQLGAAIRARNQVVNVPYPYLLPDAIPFAIFL